MFPAGVTGAFAAIALTFPIAALSVLVYRFPIPFGGYVSGPSAVPLSLGAVAFYGVAMGGFIVVGLLGFVAGVVAERVARANGKPVVKMTFLCALLVAFLAVFTLAVLDKLIGPW